MQIHVHIHSHSDTDKKIDQIIELLTQKNEAELDVIIKKIKKAIKDIKSTPVT